MEVATMPAREGTERSAPQSDPGREALARAGPCLVTGGSGFLGINLARHLLARGVHVRTLDLEPFDYPERDRVDARLGDVRDPRAVDAAVAGMRTVVHAAAALPLAPPREILTTAVDGTRLLLEAAARHGVDRLVFVSSTAVYGIPDHHPILETDALHGVGPYGQSKIDAERLCEAARARGACVPVLRPKSFVGPERLGAFEILYEWAAEGRAFPVLGRGDNPYQLLDVADLCDAIERCLVLDAGRVNETFNVGAASFGTMAGNWQAVLDRAGHGRRVVRLPAAPAVLALRALHALGWSPLYEWIYETAGRDSVVSIARARERLGWSPRRSNADALVANFDWYLANRDAVRSRTGVTHRVPWDKGFLKWAKRCF
jgi:nucleoside-diphosphate-sugar epimerase